MASLIGLLGLAYRVPAPRLCAAATAPRWFCPLAEFSLDEPRPPADTLPLLLVLPGLDGSGITAFTQYPELSLEYELKVLTIASDDRSSFSSLVELVASEIAIAGDRPCFVMGESLGCSVALAAARKAAPSGLVLVSPATGWDRTALGSRLAQLLSLPDWLLGLIIGISTYQILDTAQFTTSARRIVTGERPPLLDSDVRLAYTYNVVGQMASRLALPPATIRHRLQAWAAPSIAAGRSVADVAVPMLVVAGTADLRVPAVEEAERFAAEAGATVHFVEGAGHAGVTDDRLDLRRVMRSWRDAG